MNKNDQIKMLREALEQIHQIAEAHSSINNGMYFANRIEGIASEALSRTKKETGDLPGKIFDGRISKAMQEDLKETGEKCPGCGGTGTRACEYLENGYIYFECTDCHGTGRLHSEDDEAAFDEDEVGDIFCETVNCRSCFGSAIDGEPNGYGCKGREDFIDKIFALKHARGEEGCTTKRK